MEEIIEIAKLEATKKFLEILQEFEIEVEFFEEYCFSIKIEK